MDNNGSEALDINVIIRRGLELLEIRRQNGFISRSHAAAALVRAESTSNLPFIEDTRLLDILQNSAEPHLSVYYKVCFIPGYLYQFTTDSTQGETIINIRYLDKMDNMNSMTFCLNKWKVAAKEKFVQNVNYLMEQRNVGTLTKFDFGINILMYHLSQFIVSNRLLEFFYIFKHIDELADIVKIFLYGTKYHRFHVIVSIDDHTGLFRNVRDNETTRHKFLTYAHFCHIIMTANQINLVSFFLEQVLVYNKRLVEALYMLKSYKVSPSTITDYINSTMRMRDSLRYEFPIPFQLITPDLQNVWYWFYINTTTIWFAYNPFHGLRFSVLKQNFSLAIVRVIKRLYQEHMFTHLHDKDDLLVGIMDTADMVKYNVMMDDDTAFNYLKYSIKPLFYGFYMGQWRMGFNLIDTLPSSTTNYIFTQHTLPDPKKQICILEENAAYLQTISSDKVIEYIKNKQKAALNANALAVAAAATNAAAVASTSYQQQTLTSNGIYDDEDVDNYIAGYDEDYL